MSYEDDRHQRHIRWLQMKWKQLKQYRYTVYTLYSPLSYVGSCHTTNGRNITFQAPHPTLPSAITHCSIQRMFICKKNSKHSALPCQCHCSLVKTHRNQICIFLFVCDDGLYTDLTLLERSKMFPNVKGPTIFNDRTISNISQLSHWSPWPCSKSQFPTIDNLYYKKLLSCWFGRRLCYNQLRPVSLS